MTRIFELGLFAAAGLAALLLGGWTMVQEAAPTLRNTGTPTGRLAAMATADDPIGISLLTQRSTLLDCEYALRADQSLELRYADPAVSERIPTLCEEIGEHVGARNPGNSFAWLVAASGAMRLGDSEKTTDMLTRSYITAPRELWLIKMRFDAIRHNDTTLSPALQKLFEDDLAILISDVGLVWDIAKLYVDRESFRPVVNLALERSAPDAQRSFLTAVQSILTRRGR